MGLNVSKGNMFGFVTHTWNPIRFRCDHDCEYCYIKKGKFHVNLPEEPELKDLKKERIGSGNKIFIGSSTDIWSDEIPNSFLLALIDFCSVNENEYLFLTKNPRRYLDFLPIIPDSSILGTTLETNRDYEGTKAPSSQQRIDAIMDLRNARAKTMISIEPIIDFDLNLFYKILIILRPGFIAIGANTNTEVKLPEPPKDKILKLIKSLEKAGVKIIKKSNLERLIK